MAPWHDSLSPKRLLPPSLVHSAPVCFPERRMDEELPDTGTAGGATRESIAALAKAVMGDRAFILVSNREPYEHVKSGSKTILRRTVGGVVSALEPVVATTGGTWVAWGSGSADREAVDAHDRVALPPDDPSYTLRRVWLSAEEVEKYYDGQVNQTLWPLCHLQTDKVRFLRSEWDVYQAVNRRFAEAVTEELDGRPGVVWFQDYHFATAPAMLRHERPDVFIMQFWHIPWPPWEIFRQHPQRDLLLQGLLGCDVIGMQLELHCENFLDCVEKEFGLPVDRERGYVLLAGRTVRVYAIPISIDAATIDAVARTPATEERMRTFALRYNPRGIRIGIGVERADYTKGILLRLRALDALFTQYPQWKNAFTFLQVSPGSRTKIPAYALHRQAMERTIRDLNRRHGTPDWQPVLYLAEPKGQQELVALFRLADIAVVSSRQDGMNLVAKEFIASRCDEQGVLVLSEFAGASEEMPQSVGINPYDVEGFAHALHTALQMGAAEQGERMRQLRHHLFQNTVFDWLEDILHHIPAASDDPKDGPLPLLEHLNEMQEKIRSFGKVELFCDYDGVLTPIVSRPEEAHLDEHMRDLLVRLRNSANVHVSIISGRALSDVSALIGIEHLTYAGNHGLEVDGPRVHRIHPEARKVRGILETLYEELRFVMREFPGVIIEDKQLGLSMHYRLAEKSLLPAITNHFYALVKKHDPQKLLRITPGKAVLEVRPNVPWNKGKAVVWLMDKLHGAGKNERVIFYLGDDVTDEDAFRALRHTGVTIFVGDPQSKETAAQYYLPDVSAVATFLEWLARNAE